MPKKTIVRITWSCIYCADEIRHGAKLFDFTQRDSEVKNAFFCKNGKRVISIYIYGPEFLHLLYTNPMGKVYT